MDRHGPRRVPGLAADCRSRHLEEALRVYTEHDNRPTRWVDRRSEELIEPGCTAATCFGGLLHEYGGLQERISAPHAVPPFSHGMSPSGLRFSVMTHGSPDSSGRTPAGAATAGRQSAVPKRSPPARRLGSGPPRHRACPAQCEPIASGQPRPSRGTSSSAIRVCPAWSISWPRTPSSFTPAASGGNSARASSGLSPSVTATSGY
jgi:hypothetical protein